MYTGWFIFVNESWAHDTERTFICLIATKANAATGLFCFGNYEKIDTFYSDIFNQKNLLKDVGTQGTFNLIYYYALKSLDK